MYRAHRLGTCNLIINSSSLYACVLVIHCYITNYPKCSGLKQWTFIIPQFLRVRNLGVAWLGSAGSLTKVQSRCQLGLPSLEAWLRLEGLLSSILTYLTVDKSFDSCNVGPFHGAEMAFFQERERERASPKWNLGSEIWSLLLYSIGHIDQSWYNVGRDYTRVWILRGGDHWGLFWRLATTGG